MRTMFMIFAIYNLTAGPVHAAGTFSPASHWYGIGGGTCKNWLADRRRLDGGSSVSASESWIAGLLSGVSALTGENLLSQTDLPGAASFVDGFCNKNSGDTVANAARALINALRGNFTY